MSTAATRVARAYATAGTLAAVWALVFVVLPMGDRPSGSIVAGSARPAGLHGARRPAFHVDDDVKHDWIMLRGPNGRLVLVGHARLREALILSDQYGDGRHFVATAVSGRCSGSPQPGSALVLAGRRPRRYARAVPSPDAAWARSAIRDGCDGPRRWPSRSATIRQAVDWMVEAVAGRTPRQGKRPDRRVHPN